MKFLSIIFFLISLLVLSCIYIPPTNFWIGGFITLLIPITIILNIALLIFLGIRRNFLAVFPLVIVILSFKFILSSYAIHFGGNADIKDELTVLSYNTSNFIKPDAYSDALWPKSDEMMDWVSEFPAEIKCFQEFYNNDSSENWNVIDKMVTSQKYYHYFSGDYVSHTVGKLGVAIFSKYPIVNQGEILYSTNSYNRAAFADILYKGDTVRVLNFHLQSMEIKKAKLSNESSFEDIISNFKFLYYRIKHGSIDRSEQTQLLLDFIENTPYKMIVCGDFNETPYSYVYNAFNKNLYNAHEKVGNGFGFTYNGKTLFFLRIDNQFYSKGLKAVNFQTHRDVDYSDHFPISGNYVLTSEE